MCKKSGESVDHLLLDCDVARDLWSYFLTLFGVGWSGLCRDGCWIC